MESFFSIQMAKTVSLATVTYFKVVFVVTVSYSLTKLPREQHQVYWSQRRTRNRTLRHLARMASLTVMSNL